MSKIDISKLKSRTGSGYPAPYNQGFETRHQTSLGDPMGITQFGANLVRLEPGARSSLRHWHEQQDEFLVVTEGQLVLVDDDGETQLNEGDCCAFPKGRANGHQIVNQSQADGSFVVIGTRTEQEQAWYSDIDMKVTSDANGFNFTRRDGSDI